MVGTLIDGADAGADDFIIVVDVLAYTKQCQLPNYHRATT